MLTWTASGSVPVPTTVQIRVQRSYPGRIRAGAPEPTRSMSQAEIERNLTHFTEGLRTPRTTPCHTVVWSGIGVATRPDLGPLVDHARAVGLRTVVLHAGIEDLEGLSVAAWQGRIDRLVVPMQPGGALTGALQVLASARAAGLPVSTNTVLTQNALPELAATARALAAARPDDVTFTYPFPVNGDDATNAPPPLRAVAALHDAWTALDAAGVPASVKGLPACFLGPDAHRLRRSQNRWYVDADHQCEKALLFFPDVVAFHKDESCRFCTATDRCDGFFATYLRRPGTPPLRPLEAATGS